MRIEPKLIEVKDVFESYTDKGETEFLHSIYPRILIRRISRE